ncbi:hypothetical protein B0T16DRAFT_456866 [Cercophora newfieldiana]|uniref:Uncharacterized protein n=1 Tax=Cercophora newfieldiana TaxID=92897 RepID=A0AA39YBW5_9PEZI|nr:hypothetical protein B0T16DRAFT_456866 [Cercophora newfieldiana]
MSANRTFDEILKAVELQHDLYIKQLRLLHEATASGPARASSPTALKVEKNGNSPSPSPGLRAITFSSDTVHNVPHAHPPGLPRIRRLSGLANDGFDPGYPATFNLYDRRIRNPSVDDAATANSDDAGDDSTVSALGRAATFGRPMPDSYATSLIASQSFSMDDLKRHLVSCREAPETTITALGEVWDEGEEINESKIIERFEEFDSDYTDAVYEVYEVGKDGTPETKHDHTGLGGDGLDWRTVWHSLREVNPDKDAVGRMTILQEPSPLMLGAARLTMKDHFDVDELLQHLISTTGNKGKTRALMTNRAFETKSIRQRSFFFVFKYYTVVGEGLTPAPWQAFDSRPPDKRSPDHIDITETSSVLALSLGGDPVSTPTKKLRRGGSLEGKLYDTFAPWHLFAIQCYPDDLHSMHNGDSKHFLSGPYAFLDSLRVEYRDAGKRYNHLNELITKLITPPSQFMFDARLRDKLLFEDSAFTYSRRYFWAYNTLGVINDGIKSMRAAYTDTFTREFWAGRHPTLWPLNDPDSAASREYLVHLAPLRRELEAAVEQLHEVWKKNEHTRDEIRSLREQLFSGSSVKESRRAIEQGDNIKILTSVSMIFLPLTFVTSVFSITTLEVEVSDWPFPVTMTLVCIPFFLLILVLTRPVMEAARKSTAAIKIAFHYLTQRLAPILPHASDAGKHHPRRHQRGGAGTGSVGPGGVKRTQSMLHHHHQQQAEAGKWYWPSVKAGNLRWRPWAKGTVVVEGTAEKGKDSDAIV